MSSVVLGKHHFNCWGAAQKGENIDNVNREFQGSNINVFLVRFVDLLASLECTVVGAKGVNIDN